MENKLRQIIDSNKPGTITHEGKRAYISKEKIKEIKAKEKEGGVLPLLALLPLIFGGLGAAGAVAGGVASAVNSAKQSQLADAQRKVIENRGSGMMLNPYHGNGLYLDPYQGRGIADFLKQLLNQSGVEEEGKKAIKNILKNLSDGVNIRAEGNGLFLSPNRKE